MSYKAQQISEHCIFQKRLRSKKSLKIKKMVPKLKKSPKIVELCLKLVKFLVFTQKIQKKMGFGSSEKFCMELALFHVVGNRIDCSCLGPLLDLTRVRYNSEF